MKETHDFLMPNYFPQFSCKMGECRSACCQGWPISITMQNYFSLLGLDCRRELRDNLDRAMYLVDRPTEDEYARFLPQWDGNCRLRMEDGRCSLHAELGEDILPDICRLYPRGLRSSPGYECSCAGSCEAVLELLIRQTEPISFRTESLTIQMPRTSKGTVDIRWQKVRLEFIRKMQDRSVSLPQRIADIVEEPVREDWPGSLAIVRQLVERLDEFSDSIRDYGETVLEAFSDSGERYLAAKRQFEERFPDWEIFFEHMMVNHMFFTQSPRSYRPGSGQLEEFMALAAVYVLLRFLAVGWTADRESESDLIDVCAAVFRLIEHTEFDRYAPRLLKTLGCTEIRDVCGLLCL